MNFPVVLAARLMIEFEAVPPFAIAGIGYHSRNEAFSKRFSSSTEWFKHCLKETTTNCK